MRRFVLFATLVLFAVAALAAPKRYIARQGESAVVDVEAAFNGAFGSTSLRTWTDDGRRLLTYIGRSPDPGFTSADAVLSRLAPFLLVPAASLRLKREVTTRF